MPIELLDHTWPLIKIYVNGALCDDDLDQYHERHVALFARGKHVLLEIAARDTPMMASGIVRRRAHWIAQHRKRLQRTCLGGAYVLPSPVTRGAFKAVTWLQPLPFVHEVFSEQDPAESWARGRLAAHL